MAAEKHLNLKEARRKKQIDKFADEHPADGDEQEFDDLLGVRHGFIILRCTVSTGDTK